MKDSQRGAVYAWERAVCKRWPVCDGELTLAQCVELVRRVWHDYRPGDDPPKVCDGRGRRRACGSRWEIKLPRWARTKLPVLHEIAHSISPASVWHGREFAALVLELWVRYAGVPRVEARAMAVHQRPRRVRFAVAADVPRRVTKEWVKWNERLSNLNEMVRQHRVAEPVKYKK